MKNKTSKSLLDRFLQYVKIDTQSDEHSPKSPSTQKQFDLARLLLSELQKYGIHSGLDENGYLMAKIPSNIDKTIPKIGFIAHMDTSPDMSGAGVNPQIVKNYDGGKIVLNNEKNILLSPEDFPELEKYKGQTLITTDGTTLLGADDKAGIAIIMTLVDYIHDHPEFKHGEIRIGFTPDEEIGRGADHFDLQKFDADFAFTVDGGETGELEYENFNAAMASVTIQGRNVHPGTAKGKMINSMHVAKEFDALLPQKDRPEYTEGYEGFYHLIDFNGNVEKTIFRYLVRDHDRKEFDARKKVLIEIAAKLNGKYGTGTVKLDLKDQYYNMREKIEPVFHVVELARDAMKELGIKPLIKPIRGGTDGARLSHMGLPTPNLFTGGHNFHGRYEYISLESMEKALSLLLKIIEKNAD